MHRLRPRDLLNFDTGRTEKALARLNRALSDKRPDKHCFRLWSEFVRTRDGDRCVDCHSIKQISAHHICRKSFMPQARFQTGNGIALCKDCHREVHAGFNGRPDMGLPMDAQSGEKIEAMQRLYGALCEDAKTRGIMRDDFYFLSDSVLARFKMFQGFDPGVEFPGRRLEQALLIWQQCPRHTLQALANAMGFELPATPVLPGQVLLFFES